MEDLVAKTYFYKYLLLMKEYKQKIIFHAYDTGVFTKMNFRMYILQKVEERRKKKKSWRKNLGIILVFTFSGWAFLTQR